MPLLPLLGRCQQAVSHVAEELDLHDVDLGDRYAGHFGPGLVRVRIIIQNCIAVSQRQDQEFRALGDRDVKGFRIQASALTFISQHQRYRQQPILASAPSLDYRIDRLQPVDE